MQRLPTLDGLRGIAIALVMASHLTPRSLANEWPLPFGLMHHAGMSGVDLFFVLSGFLITGILLDSRGSAGATRRFYLKRILRIVPAYYFMIVLFAVIFPLLFPGGSPYSSKWTAEPLWHWTFLSNFHYFDERRFLLEPLSISWSLAIEEQFYLVWPWIVLGLPQRWLVRICWGMIATAPLVRLALALGGATEVMIYVFTPARMDTLAAGALLALAWRSPPLWELAQARKRRAMLTALGALAVSTAVELVWPWFNRGLTVVNYSALTLFYAALLVWSLDPAAARLRRHLTSRPLALLGLYSYSIYLTNLAVTAGLMALVPEMNAVVGPWIGQVVAYPVGVGACLAAGAALHHLVEAPFLRLKARL